MATRVLIVEDDNDVRAMLRMLLEGEGHIVVEAATAEDAWTVFGEVPVDAALVDLKLPGQHGFELCRMMRRESDVPIIIGQPLEHGLRTCWLSLKLAEAMGLPARDRSCVYHVALLRFLGCTSDASETAVFAGGDDVALNASFAPMVYASPAEKARFLVRHLAEDLPVRHRMGRVARALADPRGERRSL